jgi:hypothetical protein
MELTIVIDSDGDSVEVKTISIVEDYWHDYLYFKAQADLALKEGSQLKNRRYLRAALLMFTAYLEGVVNNWCISLQKRSGASKSTIDTFLRKSLPDKCDFLTKEASKKVSGVSNPQMREVKRLRNSLVHLVPGKDADLFENVSEKILNNSESVIIPWLDAVGKIIGEERHPNTQDIGRQLAAALGISLKEEYSGESD